MNQVDIDEVDRAILHALQEDARHLSSEEIGERAGIAGSTVRKRIQRLENEGLIRAYRAEVNYQAAGYNLRMMLFCTASIAERGKLVPEILELEGVTSVQELVSGQRNLLVTVVGTTDDEITDVAQQLIDMGLEITDEVLVRTDLDVPFDRFLGP